jgi:hypothetical protein
MANAWALSALWVGLALIATLLAIWFKVATALSEIIVGTVAQLVMDHVPRWNRRHRAHLSCRR